MLLEVQTGGPAGNASSKGPLHSGRRNQRRNLSRRRTKTPSEQEVAETQWYGASRRDLREGIRILNELRKDVSEHGFLYEETWKNRIIKVFGVGFHEALTE
jgi:hypothetical protein